MNMKLTIITFFLALITITSTAQTKSEENPGWLWEISGNGITEKSYLFGTCHGDGHIFTKEEMFGIYGLEAALGKVEKVLFEGGMDSTTNTEVDKEAIEKFIKWLKNPGQEWMMPQGTYYKPLYDTVAHFNEVNKFLYYKMKDRRNRQTLWGVCKSQTQKHVAKRYMIAEKLLPLHHESYQQYKYV